MLFMNFFFDLGNLNFIQTTLGWLSLARMGHQISKLIPVLVIS